MCLQCIKFMLIDEIFRFWQLFEFILHATGNTTNEKHWHSDILGTHQVYETFAILKYGITIKIHFCSCCFVYEPPPQMEILSHSTFSQYFTKNELNDAKV